MWEAKVEQYVREVVDTVSRACEDAKIPESFFWHWLGNSKFKRDNGNLTTERARQIRLYIDELIREFCEATEE